MSQDSGLDFAITSAWKDLTAQDAGLVNALAWVSNRGWAPVLVVFTSSTTAPTGGGYYLKPGDHITGNAAHIWVSAVGGQAIISAGTGEPQITTLDTGDVAATSNPLTGTISDTLAHVIGPFTPQLGRAIVATINAIATATGSAQLLRSTDGGATQLAVTRNSSVANMWNFTSVLGAIVNEAIWQENDAAATFYLAVTLSTGTITYRLAQ